MKKIITLFALFAYVLAVIGGIGYAVYGNAYVIAIAIVVLAVMAFPEAKKLWNYLNS